MSSLSTKVGHGIAKALGIKLDYRNETDLQKEKASRGESVFTVDSADTYVEVEPTAGEWLREFTPGVRDALRYFSKLFPFTHWLHRYNVQWLIGDLVAGITIGAVVVPQGMAYAKLADLPVQFGLYSAFMGTLIYWLFATSKDITIGPVAVMSTLTGNIIIKTRKQHPNLDPHVIASALSIIAGAIIAFLGLARLGFIVDFISLTSVTAFITGSSFNIAIGQVPTLLGISSKYVNNRAPTYWVVINTLKHLGDAAHLDVVMGITSLLMLYIIKYSMVFAAKKWPRKARWFFFANTLRTVFVILLYTLISWLANRKHRKHPRFSILQTVPRGFQYAEVPQINTDIIKTFASELPATVIVLLIEHISIAKSFGRINNYQIDPSQELLAIGATNLLGPFLGAYPATGSFTRTAIKSKAGVRTPFAGVYTAIVVLLAIYALPAVFFYVSNAVLAAVIIHAVLDLIMPANQLYQFWRISPLEVPIFLAGVLVTVFSSIENGVYVTICVSAGLLLWRLAKARGRFLGRVKVHSVVGDHLVGDKEVDKGGLELRNSAVDTRNTDLTTRNVYLPIDHHDGSNPSIEVSRPYPGIFIYRFSEGYNYPNASHYLDYMVHTIFKETRRTDPQTFKRPGDRPWNDPGPRKGKEDQYVDWSRPTLKAVILDFSSINNADVTSVQHLIDVRNQLDRYAAPETVDWHIACITNRWTKRALAAAGFGYPTPTNEAGEFRRWKPLYSVAEMGGIDSAAEAAQRRDNELRRSRQGLDEETTLPKASAVNDESIMNNLDKELSGSKAYHHAYSQEKAGTTKVAVVQGLNRPLFHVDLTSALQSAIANVERKEQNSPVIEPHKKGYGTVDDSS